MVAYTFCNELLTGGTIKTPCVTPAGADVVTVPFMVLMTSCGVAIAAPFTTG